MSPELSYEDLGLVFEGLFAQAKTTRNEDGTYTRTYDVVPPAEGVASQLVRMGVTLPLNMEDVRRALENVKRAYEPLVSWLAAPEVREALRCSPLPKRRKRYEAQERRRRNEALRQMAAYQRRLTARVDDAVE